MGKLCLWTDVTDVRVELEREAGLGLGQESQPEFTGRNYRFRFTNSWRTSSDVVMTLELA